MISDYDLEYNMALYMGAMQKKYQNTQEKRKQLQLLLNSSATKIQRRYRKFILKKKTRALITIQRWWKKCSCQNKQTDKRLIRFRKLFYGIIVTNFIIKSLKNMKNNQSKNFKKQTNSKSQKKIINKTKQIRVSIISRIFDRFPQFISRKSLLLAQHKYINKYRQYLKNKFNTDWQAYQERITKQLWKQINKKWVKIQSKTNQKTKNCTYLNEQDKQVEADQYVRLKLDRMYEQYYKKLQQTEEQLKNSQTLIFFALNKLEESYLKRILLRS